MPPPMQRPPLILPPWMGPPRSASDNMELSSIATVTTGDLTEDEIEHYISLDDEEFYKLKDMFSKDEWA